MWRVGYGRKSRRPRFRPSGERSQRVERIHRNRGRSGGPETERVPHSELTSQSHTRLFNDYERQDRERDEQRGAEGERHADR